MSRMRIITGLMTAMALSWGSAVNAADNGTEFGIEDDLTVLGKSGNAVDPDVEIKGFTVFGSTQTAYLIPVDTGNVVLNGAVQISSGLYSAGTSTFAANGVFMSTVVIGANNLKYGAGAAGLVMKSGGDGFAYWGIDLQGAGVTGLQNRITMYDDTLGMKESQFIQNPSDLGISMISGSSFTVNGPFESTGAVKLGSAISGTGDVTLVGAVTAQKGLAVTGDLSVSGKTTLSDSVTLLGTSSATIRGALEADGSTQLGDTKTGMHGINTAAEAGTALKVQGDDSTGSYIAKFYSGDPAVSANLAAWIKKK